MQKITIDGHGGHLCEASIFLDGKLFRTIGNTPEDAIAELLSLVDLEGTVEIDILPCETTAYSRSKIFIEEDDCIQ